MSYTNKDFVSQIRSMSKLLSSDQMITDRAILREGKDVANLLVKQSMDKRKLWQSPNVFAFFPCLEMEKVPISECCEYISETMVAKSKKKLPKIGEGTWGLAIQGVYGLDMTKKLKEVNPNRYANILKLKLNVNDVYYWVLNDHLYISNPDTKAANMFLYPAEIVSNDLLFPGADCDCMVKPHISDLCANPLDQPFYAPSDRITDIKNIVYSTLMKVYFGISIDKTSDNKDDQTKQ